MSTLEISQLLGNYGEFVGAIAIVVTLVYLATQIRQNTRQIRNEGHAGISDSYNEILRQLLADNELFKLVVLGSQGWDNLSAFEKSRFHIFFHQHLNHYRMANQLHDKGAIDDDVFGSVEDLHLNVLANPGTRIWWQMVGASLVEDGLRDRIEEGLADRAKTNQATTKAWDFYNPKNWVDVD